MNVSLTILALAGASLGLVLTLVLPRWWLSSPAARMRDRLRRHVEGKEVVARARDASPIFNRFGEDGEHPLRAWWRGRLLRAGGAARVRLLPLPSLLIGLAVAALLVRLEFLALGPAIALAAAVAVAAFAFLMELVTARWQIAFLENLNDAIELVIRAVRAGLPVVEAIRQAGAEVNEPVRSEFRRLSDSIDLGVDMAVALRQSAARVRLPEFDFFVVCLVIQRETGGQLTATLQGLTVILRRRKEIRLKVRALTAEGRMTALIVGGLPICVGVLMFFMSPEHVLRLTEPGYGRGMLVYGLASMAVGFLVVNHLSRFRV